MFAEVWKQDLGDQFQIEPSTQGVQNVHLKCGSNSMIVKLETDQEFTGVMYTKGNFYDQSEPCFASSKQKRGSRNLSMRFTFDQCNTKYDGNVFSNTVVVQNDPGEKELTYEFQLFVIYLQKNCLLDTKFIFLIETP